METHSALRGRFRAWSAVAGMAFRNLSRNKKATFLLGGVIAFGLMIVSLMQGCAGAIMGNVSENVANLAAGHIYVTGSERIASGNTFMVIRDDTALFEALEASGLEPSYVSRRAEFNATLIFEGNSTVQSVSGVDFGNETYLTERLSLVSGSFEALSDEKGIVISQTMADALQVKAGYRILAQLQTFSGQQNVGEFTVAAIVKDAGLLSLASMSAYANLSYVNRLLNLPEGSYQMLSFFLPDIKNLDQAGDAYYAALAERAQVFDRVDTGGDRQELMARLRGEREESWEGTRYRMMTLNETLSGLQDLVNSIYIASLIALSVLFLVIMVGITNTFRMIMIDRIREIGTMRALGMQKSQVLSLFLNEAVFLSLGGAAAGLALGLAVMGGLSLYDFGVDSMFAMLLRNGHLTFSLDPLLVLVNILIIGGLTLLAALMPARNASRLEPAEALRTAQ